MSWQRHVVLLLCSGKGLPMDGACIVFVRYLGMGIHTPVKEETTEVGAIFIFSASSSFVLLHA